jgi:hypothetical protein
LIGWDIIASVQMALLSDAKCLVVIESDHNTDASAAQAIVLVTARGIVVLRVYTSPWDSY